MKRIRWPWRRRPESFTIFGGDVTLTPSLGCGKALQPAGESGTAITREGYV